MHIPLKQDFDTVSDAVDTGARLQAFLHLLLNVLLSSF